jgi:hypothetical protein
MKFICLVPFSIVVRAVLAIAGAVAIALFLLSWYFNG